MSWGLSTSATKPTERPTTEFPQLSTKVVVVKPAVWPVLKLTAEDSLDAAQVADY